jgi:hypothetical protein
MEYADRNQPTRRVTLRTRLLLAAGTLMSGILVGGILDRALVGRHAWIELGPQAWAGFSLHADLGWGLIAYPVEAIGAALFVIAAAVSFERDGAKHPTVRTALLLAVASSMIGLLLTLKAAPVMLALGEQPRAITPAVAFEAFYLWGIFIRGTADLLTFIFGIWALTALSAGARSR